MNDTARVAVPPPDTLLTIGEMCDTYGVTARALRFYETRQLISPIRVGQKRLYTRRCRARLTLILRGKRFGFALDDIGELLDLYDRDHSRITQLTRTCAKAQSRLEQMQRQRVELDEAIAELQAEIDWGKRVLDEFNSANPPQQTAAASGSQTTGDRPASGRAPEQE